MKTPLRPIILPLVEALIAACLCLAFTGCGSAPEPGIVRPTPPPVAAPVAPVAEAVRRDAAASAIVATRLEGQVVGLQRSTANLRDGMQKALDEAARLRDAKAASEAELDALWKMLTDSNEKARNLFAEVEAARASADEQRDLRVAAEQNLISLARAASLRDAENETLRTQNADLVKSLDAAARHQAALTDKLRKAERNAALGTYVKGCVWFLGIAAVILLALKIFKPL